MSGFRLSFDLPQSVGPHPEDNADSEKHRVEVGKGIISAAVVEDQ